MFEVPELFTSWGFWYLVGGAIVLLAATLLIAIIVVARGILREASRALSALETIEQNVQPIWDLATALERLESIHRVARSIADKVEMLAGAVVGAPSREGRGPQ